MPASDRPVFSPRARIVFDVLCVAPGTIEDIARETKLTPRAIEAALEELKSVGRAERTDLGRWRAR